jgi:hypothetical protein
VGAIDHEGVGPVAGQGKDRDALPAPLPPEEAADGRQGGRVVCEADDHCDPADAEDVDAAGVVLTGFEG